MSRQQVTSFRLDINNIPAEFLDDSVFFETLMEILESREEITIPWDSLDDNGFLDKPIIRTKPSKMVRGDLEPPFDNIVIQMYTQTYREMEMYDFQIFNKRHDGFPFSFGTFHFTQTGEWKDNSVIPSSGAPIDKTFRIQEISISYTQNMSDESPIRAKFSMLVFNDENPHIISKPQIIFDEYFGSKEDCNGHEELLLSRFFDIFYNKKYEKKYETSPYYIHIDNDDEHKMPLVGNIYIQLSDEVLDIIYRNFRDAGLKF